MVSLLRNSPKDALSVKQILAFESESLGNKVSVDGESLPVFYSIVTFFSNKTIVFEKSFFRSEKSGRSAVTLVNFGRMGFSADIVLV